MSKASHEWLGLGVYWLTGRTSAPFPGTLELLPMVSIKLKNEQGGEDASNHLRQHAFL